MLNENELEKKKKRLKQLSNLSRDIKLNEAYKRNYISSLEKNFRNLEGYEQLINKIKRVNPNKLYEMLNSDMKYINVKDIPFNYYGDNQSNFNNILEAFSELLESPELLEYVNE